jgi:hypothetical protein
LLLIGLQRINLFRERLNSRFVLVATAWPIMLPICSSSSLVKGMSPSVLWFGAGCSCGVNRALNLLTTATHDSGANCGAGIVKDNLSAFRLVSVNLRLAIVEDDYRLRVSEVSHPGVFILARSKLRFGCLLETCSRSR